MTLSYTDIERVPRHVAIIMDGNGRWAKKRTWNRLRGHREGAESVDIITEAARVAGVEYLTLYAFSTENWSRPQDEVVGLWELLGDFLEKKKSKLITNRIRLHFIGHMEHLPEKTREKALRVKRETEANGWDMTLTLALSYGSRDELICATKAIAEKVRVGTLRSEQITDATITEHLSTVGLPDPDLIIRTSGELRISNFLLWQSAYAEYYFTDTLWPDFREPEFLEALRSYAGRTRRFGKTDEQLGG
ncbi:MAG TPA: isoprenyl transferase [bacterium]|nr:isoprenyl transferase [bacterium]